VHEVVTLASAFVELQQARHGADYDLSRRLSRSDALALSILADGPQKGSDTNGTYLSANVLI